MVKTVMRGVVRLDSMADDALVAWIKCLTFDKVLPIPLFAERIPQYGHNNWAFFLGMWLTQNNCPQFFIDIQ